MAFTIQDFQDLLELLRRHPEWRERLWELLASEEFLRLPAEVKAFREEFRTFRDQTFEEFRQETERRFRQVEEQIAALVEFQRRHYEEFIAHRQEFMAYRAETDRRFAELAEAQRRHYEEFVAYRAETDRRFAELAEAQRRLTERVEQLAEAQRRTEEQVAELVETVRRLTERVDRIEGRLRGDEVEKEYRTLPRRYRHLIRDPHILSPEERGALLEALEAQGAITPEEADSLEVADIIVRGRQREGEGEAYLVVEVSATIDTNDVKRAAERAEALQKALPQAEVRAVVAGPEMHGLAARAARTRGVWWLRDGRPFAPHEIPESML
ncbi:MAG: hypothetical protein RMM10_00075 [Anaerolineae bacterium]|uniref:hypothetical protein n=1 Tax=Thermoflexus sp. TaxID=1969742 RepID=UPI0025FFF188|nr:hypothetical protein [Thermoflexus sp.]MCS7349903.1 hypothetical protein [Thermoflexus sp.]MDW8179350.1 hypothetical protein [Anaerolineae bacterium]